MPAGKAFRKAEFHLVEALRARQADVRALYGHLTVAGSPALQRITFAVALAYPPPPPVACG
jgi:hypothetical protein